MSALAAISPRRKRTDKIARGVLLAATLLALVPLVLVLVKLISEGAGAINIDFFTKDPTGGGLFNSGIGGVKSAIVGTVLMVALASAIAVPFGIGAALYMVEYGKGTKFAAVVRYFVDVMTGVPSVVFGLFIYILLVVTNVGGGFTAWKGSLALALLMLPIVTRSAEVVLLLVPNTLRETALALGSPRWKVIARVVLPTALPGLVTGSLLAVARAAGETAPLLFTAFGAQALSTNFGNQMNSLPIQIFNDVQQPNDQLVQRAWGSALTLVVMILLLTVIARLVQRRTKTA